MGLAIHYDIKAPAKWSQAKIAEKLEQVRQFAQTLPVVSVSEMGECSGKECDFQHVRDSGREKDDAFFWAKIQGQRYVQNPWLPGNSWPQVPVHMIAFTVDPAEGSDVANFGMCRYPEHVWPANKSTAVPEWSLVFEKKNHYPQSRKLMRAFMRRWHLKKLAPSKPNVCVKDRFGETDKGGYRTDNCRGKAAIQKGRSGNFGLVAIEDRVQNELFFKFTGTAKEAEAVFASKAFQADLERIVGSEDYVTPPASGLWSACCKDQYANDPRAGGWPNFVKAHLSVLAICEKFQSVGFKVMVMDEGEFWETKDLKKLAKKIGEYDGLVAAMAGAWKDTARSAGQTAVSAMDGRPDFEHLEAGGHKTIGEYLKAATQKKTK